MRFRKPRARLAAIRVTALPCAFLAATLASPLCARERLDVPALVSRVNAFLDREAAAADLHYTDQGAFSGVVLVAVAGKPVVARAFGYANREWLIPNTLDTKFRLWSVTKIFTATAVLRLHEQGKLSIEDSICTYVERCPDAWQAIKVRQLLSHTSGLPEMDGPPPIPGKVYSNLLRTSISPSEILEQQRARPLEYVPGTRFSYNNFGFFVAGLVVEKVTGKPYDQAMQAQIFGPLGMQASGLDRAQTILPKRAAYYADAHTEEWYLEGPPPNSRESLVNDDFFDMPTWANSAGGLYSTVEDLLRFDTALDSGALLQPKTLQLMWTGIEPVPFNLPRLSEQSIALLKKAPEYGLGWDVHDVAGQRCLSHYGAGRSANTRYMRFPDDRVFIVVLANSLAMGTVFEALPKVVFAHGEEPVTNR